MSTTTNSNAKKKSPVRDRVRALSNEATKTERYVVKPLPYEGDVVLVCKATALSKVKKSSKQIEKITRADSDDRDLLSVADTIGQAVTDIMVPLEKPESEWTEDEKKFPYESIDPSGKALTFNDLPGLKEHLGIDAPDFRVAVLMVYKSDSNIRGQWNMITHANEISAWTQGAQLAAGEELGNA